MDDEYHFSNELNSFAATLSMDSESPKEAARNSAINFGRQLGEQLTENQSDIAVNKHRSSGELIAETKTEKSESLTSSKFKRLHDIL